MDSCFINSLTHFWISWKRVHIYKLLKWLWYHSMYRRTTSGLLEMCQPTSPAHSFPPVVLQRAVHKLKSVKQRWVCTVWWLVSPQTVCKCVFLRTQQYDSSNIREPKSVCSWAFFPLLHITTQWKQRYTAGHLKFVSDTENFKQTAEQKTPLVSAECY